MWTHNYCKHNANCDCIVSKCIITLNYFILHLTGLLSLSAVIIQAVIFLSCEVRSILIFSVIQAWPYMNVVCLHVLYLCLGLLPPHFLHCVFMHLSQCFHFGPPWCECYVFSTSFPISLYYPTALDRWQGWLTDDSQCLQHNRDLCVETAKMDMPLKCNSLEICTQTPTPP